MKYAAMLAQRLEQHGTGVWLVNTGWTGGGYGLGRRIPLQHSRAVVDAILAGEGRVGGWPVRKRHRSGACEWKWVACGPGLACWCELAVQRHPIQSALPLPCPAPGELAAAQYQTMPVFNLQVCVRRARASQSLVCIAPFGVPSIDALCPAVLPAPPSTLPCPAFSPLTPHATPGANGLPGRAA